MSLFSWFSNIFSFDSDVTSIDGSTLGHSSINPASGLPIAGDSSDIDIAGNPYGSDITHDHFSHSSLDEFAVNPANGLPMIGGIGGVDVEGNPFGTDSSHEHLSSSSSSISHDDTWSSSSFSSFDDS